MSTAEDLRQEVRDVITDHQRNEPTQSHAERYGSENTEESSTPPQPEEKKKEVKVSDKPVKKKLTVTDRMTSLLTPDQLKEIEEQENKENVLLEVRDVKMKFSKYEVGVNSLKELVVRAFKNNLKKKKFECLKGISFDVHRGEAVALIGKNGAGNVIGTG